MRRAVLLLGVILLSACELQEVAIVETEDAVIAEVVLRAGASTQLAWLHRTRAEGKDPLVQNAVIQVSSAAGASAEFQSAPDTICIIPRRDTQPQTHGSCYATPANALLVSPGQTYHLMVTTADGRVLTGSTTVPADFQMLRPTRDCFIAPRTTLEVRWTQSSTAWVYAAETSMRGLANALRQSNNGGIHLDRDPLRLFGLSLSSIDTTIVFPSEFGLFDRFDDDLTEALAFLQMGLPNSLSQPVEAQIVISAADRNYVNWERGSNFNPSGTVRVPSVHGDGTGVFGSLVPRSFQVSADADSLPRC